MNAIVFDTETNGTPKNYRAKMSDLWNWPRVTQLAWQKINVFTGELLNQHSQIIYPDGWTIPTPEELRKKGSKNPNFFVENNMSTERCLAEGKPLAGVLDLLIKDMNDSDILAAHNLDFDNNVVGAEMIRLKKRANKVLTKICTMQASTQYCQLPGQYGYKWPKLEELHMVLFNYAFDGAHDALSDVSATASCLVELVKRGVIIIEQKP